jgi:DNA-binding CsgD family transcriptional regulator
MQLKLWKSSLYCQNRPPSVNALRPAGVDRPIELIYRAVEDDRHWECFLQCVLQELQCATATLWMIYPGSSGHSEGRYATVSDDGWQCYLTGGQPRDPFTAGLCGGGHRVGLFMRLRPSGNPHCGGGAVLSRDEFQVSAFAVWRLHQFGPLGEGEVHWCEALIPHLRRAAALHGRFVRLKAERDALSSQITFFRPGPEQLASTKTIDAGYLLLKKQFHLTSAEIAVCTALIRGQSVGEIARQRGLSITTVRTHLARAMQKTGTHRQSELVALALGGQSSD